MIALLVAAALAFPVGSTLYADPPHSHAAHQARVYAKQHRVKDAELMRKLAEIPQAVWFTGGDTPKQTEHRAAKLIHRAGPSVPVLVVYNIPDRDCGHYSRGGAKHYRRWIDGFARGIGAGHAIVILEPDALAGLCGKHRIADLRDAVDRLHEQPNAAVYVDAGHSHWQPAKTMARRLAKVHATAFALNVANFRATDEIVAYGNQISQQMSGAHFVIDTSRNGRGPYRNQWCNPRRRGLGARPTTTTGNPTVDAFLWIKVPGESDGPCHGGPQAGRWWPKYALELARRASPSL
jgi:endoglucanase